MTKDQDGAAQHDSQSTASPLENDGVDDYAIAAAILAGLLICIIIAVVLCSFCQRRAELWRRWRLWLCPCSKPSVDHDMPLGYLPAHIAVNPAALQQGVPDIFLRHSQAARLSLEGNSCDSWWGGSGGGGDSVTETSGAWADYLRRATLRRRSSGRPGSGAGDGADTMSETDVDDEGVAKSRVVHVDDVFEGRDDVVSRSVTDDVMNDAAFKGHVDKGCE